MRAVPGRSRRFGAGARRCLACMCLALMVPGCATSAAKGTLLDDPAKRASLIEGIQSRFPERFRSVHRATLTIRGRDVALDGFLRIEGARYRFVASTGFGTTFFEIASGPDGGDTVVRWDDMLSKDAVQTGAARDIREIFLQAPTPSAALAVLPDGRLTLTDRGPGGSRSVYTFDAATERWVTYKHVIRGRAGRVLRLDDYSEPDANGCTYPRRIHVANSAERYKLDVRVVTLVPEP